MRNVIEKMRWEMSMRNDDDISSAKMDGYKFKWMNMPLVLELFNDSNYIERW